jgi:hypothetical protein
VVFTFPSRTLERICRDGVHRPVTRNEHRSAIPSDPAITARRQREYPTMRYTARPTSSRSISVETASAAARGKKPSYDPSVA